MTLNIELLAKQPKPKITMTCKSLGTHRTGTLNDMTAAKIAEVLGHKNNFGPSGDGKVTMEWLFYADDEECAIWDYKGSAQDEQFSCYGPDEIFESLFGYNYSSMMPKQLIER